MFLKIYYITDIEVTVIFRLLVNLTPIYKEKGEKQMEGISVYQDTRDELQRVRKQLSSSRVTINLDKLDEQTKREITSALQEIIVRRQNVLLTLI